MAMVPSKKGNPSEQVSTYIQTLESSLAHLAGAVRQTILSAGKETGEQINGYAPAFYYTGDMKPFDPKEYKRDIVGV